ncbi:glycosyltransferase family 2 protein [Nonomuraea sp. NPDC046802]|uniref:glycosyltransferase family 2 protein n=1 Tax=Nonomuraea sp. NPDC046802 TaxID=3154919 RepID=UPI0033C78B52
MGKSSQINLVSIIGAGDVELLPHLARHYRKLGVESFHIVCHAESESDANYERLLEECRRADIRPLHLHVGAWRETLNMRLKAYIMGQRPGDWFVIADLDEFQVYDRPLGELIQLCERVGADHVNGCFLDRVAPGGELLAVDESSIWERFPLAGAVSSKISLTLPLKTGLARGHVQLLPGHHGTVGGRALPRDAGFIQVHHFKWTESVIRRLRWRVEHLAREDRRAEHNALVTHARAALAHIDANGGRIDVADELLALAPCPEGSFAHPFWREIADEAEGWAWMLAQ